MAHLLLFSILLCKQPSTSVYRMSKQIPVQKQLFSFPQTVKQFCKDMKLESKKTLNITKVKEGSIINIKNK